MPRSHLGRVGPMLIAAVAAMAVTVRIARAADGEPSAAATRPLTANHEAARQLFEEGQASYALGEYDQAIARFRQAYELTHAPGLLFNIAQAHRLQGSCRRALDVYGHFVRLDPTSPYRSEADAQIEVLGARCGAALPPAPPPHDSAAQTPAHLVLPVVVGQAAGGRAAPALTSPRWPVRKRVALAALLGAVASGGAAGLVYGWNSGRYDEWSAEDRRLAAGTPPGSSSESWTARQDRNDALLGSIRRADNVVLGLASLAGGCLLTSAIAGLMSELHLP
jgi:tetratricopeptide (TPR) repeat protein